MGLRDITIAKKTVNVGDQTFDVRGLSYADIARAVSIHAEQASKMFDNVVKQASDGGIESSTVAAIAKKALTDFPELVGDLVASAADEPDMGATFNKLPITAQADALDKVISLTITSEGELEKFIQIVTRGLGAVTTAVVSLNGQPSKLGSGD